MATITDARRQPDGSIVLTVREEREVVIAAKDAVDTKTAELVTLAKATDEAAKLADAEALVAAKSGKVGEVVKP